MQVGQPVQFVLVVPYAHKAKGFQKIPSPEQWDMSLHCQKLPLLPEHLKSEPLWLSSSESEGLLPCSRVGGFAGGCPEVRPGDPGAWTSRNPDIRPVLGRGPGDASPGRRLGCKAAGERQRALRGRCRAAFGGTRLGRGGIPGGCGCVRGSVVLVCPGGVSGMCVCKD